MAWWTAFATAAAVPTIPISPIPLAPIGLTCGSSSSTQIASICSISAQLGDVIAGEVVVEVVAELDVEDALLVERHPDAHRHSADEL